MAQALRIRKLSIWGITICTLACGISSCVVVPYSADDVLIEWKKTINQARSKQNKKDFSAAEIDFVKARDLVKNDRSLDLFQALTLRELGLLELEIKNDAKARIYLLMSNSLFESVRFKDKDAYSIYALKHFDILYKLGKLEDRAKNYNEAEKNFKAALNTEGPEAEKEACRTDLLLVQEKLNRDSLVLIPDAIASKIQVMAKEHPAPIDLINTVYQTARDKVFLEENVNEGRQMMAALIQHFKMQNDKASELRALSYFIIFAYGVDDLTLANALCQRSLAICKADSRFTNMQGLFMAQQSQIIQKQGNNEVASKLFKKACHQLDADHTNLDVADALIEMGNFDAESSKQRKPAKKAYNKAIELLSDLPAYRESMDSAKVKLATVMAKGEDFEESQKILRSIDPTKLSLPNRFVYYVALSRNYRDMDDYPHAIAAAKNELESSHSSSSKLHALLHVSDLYKESGNKKSATEFFDKAKAFKETYINELAKTSGKSTEAVSLPRGLDGFYRRVEEDLTEQ